MTIPSLTPSNSKTLQPRPSGFSAVLEKRVLAQLKQLEKGGLKVYSQGQCHRFGQAESDLQAEIHVHDAQLWLSLASNGSIGAAEAYIRGDWSSPDLTAVIRVFVANLELLDRMEGGLALISQPLLKALHWLNRNTRRGSKRNISAHYDLGNQLFERMLDPSMMYSAAMFERSSDSLETAQMNKLERIGQKLQLRPSDHLLEIGTGWGSMAIYAASRYGCTVTTTTLSREQYDYTRQRVEEYGLSDRITVLLEDYRDLTGQYDKLVSIEMIEAVGHRYLPDYFAQCSRLLKDDGLMLLQAITIRDQRYEKAKRSVDFIQRYIFPGGALPSMTVMLESMTRHTDLNLSHMEDFGLHYARTLNYWQQNLHQHRQSLESLGYDQQFFRLWQFYLSYCEGGFLERAIGTAQLLLSKPNARPACFGLEK